MKTAASATPATYVGVEHCSQCHATEDDLWRSSDRQTEMLRWLDWNLS